MAPLRAEQQEHGKTNRGGDTGAVPFLGALTFLLLGCLSGLSPAQAQGPENILYNRQQFFRIPFDVTPGTGRLREVKLYVSEDQGQTWRPYSTAKMPQQEFVFKADHDGLYWFTTQSIGWDNRPYPPVVEGVRPDLRVCVDTRPPTILLRALPPRDGYVGVEWDVRDENLNLATLQLEYRVSPQGEWQPLAAERLASNRRYWALGTTGPLEIRLRASDLADNVAEQTIVVGGGGQNLHYAGNTLESSSTRAQAVAEPPTRLVNSAKIRVRYNIKEVGRSGVSDIELWYTTDRYGRGWRKLKQFDGRDYANRDAILEFDVPGEGRYGFTLVVRSGVKLGGVAPRDGEPPQFWVEVDTTLPVVRMQQPEMGRGSETGKLFISWTAADKNLSPQASITLSYAEYLEGQPEELPESRWRPIASDIDNTGKYVWTLPEDVPNRILVKVEAKDRAGNVGSAVSKQPLIVDLSLPKGIILDVEPANKFPERAAPPGS